MSHPKTGTPDHPVQEFITARWSPYAYSDKPVSNGDLKALFEAARWAASSYNEQPWRYIVATKDNPQEYERLLSCLAEANQAWAGNAPVLALGVISTRFARNDKPNGVAAHDLGLASGNLLAEATVRGIHVHQMAGIVPERAVDLYSIPDGFKVLTALAIGYAAEPGEVGGKLDELDAAPRTRRPLFETVFTGKWEKPGLAG